MFEEDDSSKETSVNLLKNKQFDHISSETSLKKIGTESIQIFNETKKIIEIYSNGSQKKCLNKQQFKQLAIDLIGTLQIKLKQEQILSIFNTINMNKDEYISHEELLTIVRQNKI